MKTLLSLTALSLALSLALTAMPALADVRGGSTGISIATFADHAGTDEAFDRRGRGRGRGGDDRRADDDRRGGGGGHGGRPRIPGGSGCDDPGDIPEHPECRI